LELGVQSRASDIHLEPQREGLFVRFRIDGVLQTLQQLSPSAQRPLLSRFKILAGMDITERRLPQDGQFCVETGGRIVDVRVSTLPCKYGEKVVLRLLDKSPQALSLEQLGMRPSVQGTFEEMIRRPQGLILVTGPTGSGKTTTLYSALNALKSPLRNILTLEDPVEYELLANLPNETGITQVQVNPRAGLTFASALRAALRQDPDVIMVGEMRDKKPRRSPCRPR